MSCSAADWKPRRRWCTRLRRAGHRAYLAGGCVRDLLLGRAPKDFDVATDARPDAVMALFARTFAVGAHFGVVLVPLQVDGQRDCHRGGDVPVRRRVQRWAAAG